jgi:hypothetical protein
VTTLKATLHGGGQEEIRIDKYPDGCPICHYAVEPRFQGLAHFTKRPSKIRVELIFQCPREDCQSFFIAGYGVSPYGNFQLYGCFPSTPFQRNYSEHIQAISPNFCAIENEAYNAERQGWKLVAGPGYRKALEFLIKDYLCGLRPADAETIKHIQLGPCIEGYVTNDSVKATPERAAWLGNDETHCARRWEDKDLTDLKRLIDLTVHWIEMEVMTKKVLEDMPTGKK